MYDCGVEVSMLILVLHDEWVVDGGAKNLTVLGLTVLKAGMMMAMTTWVLNVGIAEESLVEI